MKYYKLKCATDAPVVLTDLITSKLLALGMARVGVTACVLFFSQAGFAAWPQAINACKVFDRQNETATRVNFPSGPIIPKTDDTSNEQSIKPSSTLVDAGRLRTTVYDCPKHLSAAGVGADIRRQLRAEGWHKDYACEGYKCGESNAWADLFPELRSTPPDYAYSYTLMHKFAAKRIDRIAVFTADIDARPRVVLRRLAVDPATPLKLELDVSQVEPLYERTQPSAQIRFDSGSSTYTLEAKLEAVLQQSKPDDLWILVGHADYRGNEANNAVLSWQRARAVAVDLNKQGIPDRLIKIFAVSDLMPMGQSDTDDAETADNPDAELIKSRRVDLFRLAKATIKTGEAEPKVEQAMNKDRLTKQTKSSQTREARIPENNDSRRQKTNPQKNQTSTDNASPIKPEAIAPQSRE